MHVKKKEKEKLMMVDDNELGCATSTKNDGKIMDEHCAHTTKTIRKKLCLVLFLVAILATFLAVLARGGGNRASAKEEQRQHLLLRALGDAGGGGGETASPTSAGTSAFTETFVPSADQTDPQATSSPTSAATSAVTLGTSELSTTSSPSAGQTTLPSSDPTSAVTFGTTELSTTGSPSSEPTLLPSSDPTNDALSSSGLSTTGAGSSVTHSVGGPSQEEEVYKAVSTNDEEEYVVIRVTSNPQGVRILWNEVPLEDAVTPHLLEVPRPTTGKCTERLSIEAPVSALYQSGNLLTFEIDDDEPEEGEEDDLEETNQFRPLCLQKILRYAELQKLDEELDLIYDKRGSIELLAGNNICPSCPRFNFLPDLEDDLVKVENLKQAEVVVKAFLSEDNDIVKVGDEDPSTVDYHIVSVESLGDEEAGGSPEFLITTQQLFGGMDVLLGRWTLLVSDGAIVQFSGTMWTDSDLPAGARRLQEGDHQGEPPSSYRLSNEAHVLSVFHREMLQHEEYDNITMARKENFQVVRRYVDTRSKGAVAVVYHPSSQRSYRLCEKSQQILDQVQYPQISLVGRTTNQGYYPIYGNYRQPYKNRYHSRSIMVERRKFQREYIMDCMDCMDHNSDGTHMEPRVEWAHSGVYHCEDAASGCSTPNGAWFMNIDPTQRNKRAYLLTAYVWAHVFKEFVYHWRNCLRYSHKFTNSENVVIKLYGDHEAAPCERGCVSGNYVGSSGTEYQVHIKNKNLETLVHELGHVTSYQYDYNCDDYKRNIYGVRAYNDAVCEGWAIHMVLRFGFWRHQTRIDGSRASEEFDRRVSAQDFNYNTTVSDMDEDRYKVQQYWKDGQLVPGSFRGGDMRDWTVYDKWSASCKCKAKNSCYDPHACSSPISMIWWEVANNRCAISFGNCEFNEAILRDATMAPERVISLAYTRAIKSIADSSTMSGFFGAVSRQLRRLYQVEKVISARDYQRVHSVMHKHCVGWSHHCNDWHREFGSRLPSSRTRKQAGDGGGRTVIHTRAQDWTRFGSAYLRRHWTADAKYYVQIFEGGSMCRRVRFPKAGKVHLRASMIKPRSEGANSLWVCLQRVERYAPFPAIPSFRVDRPCTACGAGRIYWGMQVSFWFWKAQWDWFTSTYTLTIPSAGDYYVRLDHRENNYGIDVILFEYV